MWFSEVLSSFYYNEDLLVALSYGVYLRYYIFRTWKISNLIGGKSVWSLDDIFKTLHLYLTNRYSVVFSLTVH